MVDAETRFDSAFPLTTCRNSRIARVQIFPSKARLNRASRTACATLNHMRHIARAHATHNAQIAAMKLSETAR
jgi:hypothetical protein